MDVYERLISRRDVWAQQSIKPDEKGRYGYYAKKQPLTQKDIDESLLSNKKTIGIYIVNPDGNTCTNPLIDIDNHDGGGNVKEDVVKLFNELRRIQLHPYIEASSGELGQGAHIGLICKPTAAKLCKEILDNALRTLDLKGHEVFPKQIEVNKGSFGNLVKLPFQYNNRTRQRSQIINPATLEAFSREDAIKYLLALPDSVFEAIEAPKQPVKDAQEAHNELIKSDLSADGCFDSLFRLDNIKLCIKACFDDKWILHGKGDEGHNFRIAIAGNLIYNGATEQQVHDYFIKQPDYSQKATAKQIKSIVEYLAEGKRPMGCKKIIEKCPSLLNGLCDACKMRPKERKAKEKIYPKLKEDLKFTDLGNAKRLINYHGGDLRFCYPWNKWLEYNGIHWAQDDTGGIFRRAKQTIACLYVDASKLDDKERRYVVNFALSCESNHRLRSMVELAKSEPGIPVLPAHLDHDSWVLNLNNGTVELKTGLFREHRREELITKHAPVDYDLGAKCLKWLSFLDKIFRGEKDLIKFLQKAVGYSLTGSTQEQCFFIFYGHGKNGKSTFIQVIAGLLGDYAMQTSADSLMVKKFDNGISNDIARLRGARFVSAVESGEGKRLHEPLIKQITGGDKISARFLHAEFFEYTPECKIFLGTNHKPDIKGTDYAIWRRVRMIPFTVQIPEAERIADYHKILIEEELSGILNWALEGCKMWLKEGLGIPEEVKEATAEFQDEMDLVGDFLEACCEIDEEAIFPNKTLYTAYNLWSVAGQESPLTQVSFSRTLEERGYRKEKKAAGRVWYGVRLKAEVLRIINQNDGFNDGCRDMTGYRVFLNELSIYAKKPKIPSEPVILDKPVISGEFVSKYLSYNYDRIGKPDTLQDLDRLRDNMAANLELDIGVDDESSRKYVTNYCRARGWV